MTPLRLVAPLSCALSLRLPAVALAQTNTCRRRLMKVDHLRQLCTGAAGMQLRVSPAPQGIDGVTAAGTTMAKENG